ncbi:uncharacterized protein LOC107470807 [Arachis duranensis]|uniref:Uncharacterized protein LOC107470807 n=1 Tax=Arachis duranensis TaxID=130453 RepID=A0A6P4BPJ0_ARADU|nr:uncharacterized protein LOC107470807 [Arachis duranensis]
MWGIFDSEVNDQLTHLPTIVPCCKCADIRSSIPQPRFTSYVPLSLLLANLVDVVSSSRGSNWNPQPSTTAACSSSRHVSASLSLSVIQPEAAFVIDLNRTHDGEVGDTEPFGDVTIVMIGTPNVVPDFRQGGAPDGVEDVFQDEDDDDVESTTIADDSDDELARSTPTGGSGAISSGTPHRGYLACLSDFGAYDTHDTGRLAKFQVGQQFQDKEEAVQSVKTYSIRRGVEYKVLESDYHKYHGRCKEFGNRCTRLIRISLCQCRGISEVKRADVAMSIKVLQNATEAYFGFRLTYRSVWMAKQKVMAQIYRDLEESYNELSRWVLGV